MRAIVPPVTKILIVNARTEVFCLYSPGFLLITILSGNWNIVITIIIIPITIMMMMFNVSHYIQSLRMMNCVCVCVCASRENFSHDWYDSVQAEIRTWDCPKQHCYYSGLENSVKRSCQTMSSRNMTPNVSNLQSENWVKKTTWKTRTCMTGAIL